ncbi:hypothetical protein GGR28_002158 [Lewinella aquimaris]|uniref:Uncharacterized protein n=1 Tax=Neolewinella aquimaris TaxID=1835722 RepID=A0A840E6F6_9BACT|nr:hypothetical protein [Neolewinella aquimaris]
MGFARYYIQYTPLLPGLRAINIITASYPSAPNLLFTFLSISSPSAPTTLLNSTVAVDLLYLNIDNHNGGFTAAGRIIPALNPLVDP